MEPAVRCADLAKTYDGRVEAVRGIDLEIPAGECFGLLGPNGAGKTTTIEMLEGLLDPTRGEIRILGHRWGENDEALRQKLGISLQETKLADKLTVEETVALFRSFFRRGPTVAEIVRLVQLEEKQGARVGTLSGGQKQRLSIACALAGDPELLFLDEPTTGLDPEARAAMWEELERLAGAERLTILLTTHYLEEAEELCQDIALIRGGVDRPGLDAQGRSSRVQVRRIRKGDLSRVREVVEQTFGDFFERKLGTRPRQAFGGAQYVHHRWLMEPWGCFVAEEDQSKIVGAAVGVLWGAVGILGPVMILAMGAFVFVIVIALLLPIFQLNQLVR